MTPQPLHSLIATYILSQSGQVSLTTIMDRAKGRFTDEEVRNAMRVIHKTRRDIKVRDDGTDQWYSLRTLKPKAAPLTYHSTAEERARMDQGLDDYYMHSPLVTDRERECYCIRKADPRGTRNRYKTCECETCTSIKNLLMTKIERGFAEKDRQRQVLKEIL